MEQGIKYAFGAILTGVLIVTMIFLAAGYLSSENARASLSSIPIQNQTTELLISANIDQNISIHVINQGSTQQNRALFIEVRNHTGHLVFNYIAKLEMQPYSEQTLVYEPGLEIGKDYHLSTYTRNAERPYVPYLERYQEDFKYGVKP